MRNPLSCQCLGKAFAAYEVDGQNSSKAQSVKDSGSTQEFDTGAHRDSPLGKGRPDLIPMAAMVSLTDDAVIDNIRRYLECGSTNDLYDAIRQSLPFAPDDVYEFISDDASDSSRMYAVLLDVSLLYEAGAEKYGENNWMLGMPVSRFIQSALRHWLKHRAGWLDEPHYRAFVWNVLCVIWMHENKPEFADCGTKGADV